MSLRKFYTFNNFSQDGIKPTLKCLKFVKNDSYRESDGANEDKILLSSNP
jgi:hypothetical protein